MTPALHLVAVPRPVLQILNSFAADDPLPETAFAGWVAEMDAKRKEFPMRYPDRGDVIVPQWAVQVSPPATPRPLSPR